MKFLSDCMQNWPFSDPTLSRSYALSLIHVFENEYPLPPLRAMLLMDSSSRGLLTFWRLALEIGQLT